MIPKNADNMHTVLPDTIDLLRVFSRRTLRSLWQDFVIQYKNRYFQIEQWWYVIYPKKKLEVQETIDWNLRILVWEKDVFWHELSYTTVKKNRAIYQYQKQRVTKEARQKSLTERKATRLKVSKERQKKYKKEKALKQQQQLLL